MRIERDGSSEGYSATLRSDGVLAVTIRGVWAADAVDMFFDAFAPLYAEARRRHGAVHTLTIVERVQSPAVALRVRDRSLLLKQPGDRRAFVVATFLSKLQIKRLGTNDAFGLFTDQASAEAWLKR